MSKVLEKIVLHQLSSFLDTHNILDKYQSGFRAFHSTESALLKVFNDVLLAADSGKSTVVILLDQSAAFDTVDHTILLNRLKTCVSIQGSALTWFASYLESRSYSVMLGNKYFSPATLTCGIP